MPTASAGAFFVCLLQLCSGARTGHWDGKSLHDARLIYVIGQAERSGHGLWPLSDGFPFVDRVLLRVAGSPEAKHLDGFCCRSKNGS